MPNFVGLMECANTYGIGCFAVPPGLYISVLLVAATAVGWRLGAKDYKQLMHRFRWVFGAGAVMMAVSFLVIVGFFALDPDAVLGVEENGAINALWTTVISAFGLGFLLIAGALGLGLGAVIATRFGGSA